MKRIIYRFVIVIGFTSIVTQEISATSFDCDNVTESTEQAICNSSQLSRLDDKMEKLYDEVSDISRVRQEQREWIEYRNRECGGVERCLEDLYRKRISELSRLARSENYASVRPSRKSREIRTVRSSRESRVARPARPVFGKTIFSPEKGIVCDKASDFCADSQGISLGLTKEYLGQEAADSIGDMIERDQMDTVKYTMSNGVYCDAGERKCYKGSSREELDSYYTNWLY